MKPQRSSCLTLSALTLSLLAGCAAGQESTAQRQEAPGSGIVAGTLGELQRAQEVDAADGRSVITGHVLVLEGGAYVVRELDGSERRIPHDQNTRIDRPAHVGDRIQAVMDDRGRAVSIRNSDSLESEG